MKRNFQGRVGHVKSFIHLWSVRFALSRRWSEDLKTCRGLAGRTCEYVITRRGRIILPCWVRRREGEKSTGQANYPENVGNQGLALWLSDDQGEACSHAAAHSGEACRPRRRVTTLLGADFSAPWKGKARYWT